MSRRGMSASPSIGRPRWSADIPLTPMIVAPKLGTGYTAVYPVPNASVIYEGVTIRKALVIGTIVALLLVTPLSAGSTWQWQYKKWMPTVWQRLAWCESGTRPPSNPNWKHNSGTYQGGFGFYYGSWDQFNTFGYPNEAYNATPWQQWKVALAIHARYGFTGWGCYNNSWVRYG